MYQLRVFDSINRPTALYWPADLEVFARGDTSKEGQLLKRSHSSFHWQKLDLWMVEPEGRGLVTEPECADSDNNFLC